MPSQKTKKPQSNGAQKAKRSHPAGGSYFLSLELENVRCFGVKQVLDLSDGHGRPARWTILLGENGTGKTTVLQLLAASSRLLQEARRLHSYAHEISFTTRSTTFLRGVGELSATSRTEIALGTVLMETHLKPLRTWHQLEIGSLGEVFTEPDPSYGDSFRLPMSFAYGVHRRLGTITLGQDDPVDLIGKFFADGSSLRNAEEWLRQLDYSASKASPIQEKQRKRLAMMKKVLIKVLPDVSEIRFASPTEEKPIPGVEFRTPYGWVPLRQLGYGYKTMVSWIVDFSSRMVEHYPDSPDPLAEPAVVLVDEIDLHLHPKWQRELIGFLTERFPNTQFIVTAHSPLIVQSAPDANLVLLKREGDHVVIENNPETIRGWRVDQVLTSELFGLETARPPDMEKLLMRRKELLTKSSLTKAEQKELAAIEAKLGSIPTGESFEQAKTMALIEKSLEMLEKNRNTKP